MSDSGKDRDPQDNPTTGVVVTSIADSVSFLFGRASGNAVAWDETIMWSLTRTSWTS